MKDPTAEEIRTVIYQIIQYLLSHPQSGDTLENIVMWWIPSERLLPRWEEVEEAITYLEIHRWVISAVLPGGKKLYRLNPDKKPEAARLLQSLSEGQSVGGLDGPPI